MKDEEYHKLLQKYKEKIKEEFGADALQKPRTSSQEFTEFKIELYPKSYSIYE